MRYRVTFVGSNNVGGVEFEADELAFEKDGSIHFFALIHPLCEDASSLGPPVRHLIIAYNRDVWRSVTAVGAFEKASKALEVKREIAPGRHAQRETTPA
jgi:hypothetical protein